MLLRSLIKDVNGISYKPCIVSSDICNENVEKMTPAELHNFLCLLITGKSLARFSRREACKHSCCCTGYHLHDLKQALQIPKHVALPIAIKHLTGNKMIMNKLRHCICYEDVMQIQTAIANDIISKMSDEGWFVPSNIFAGSPGLDHFYTQRPITLILMKRQKVERGQHMFYVVSFIK